MSRSRSLGLMDRLNPLVVACLHAPGLHHLLSAGLATITSQGRRSGRRICFPVGYHDQGDAVLVMVSEAAHRSWWRNFREPWPATLRLRGQEREATGLVLSPDDAEYRRRVERSFARAAFIPRIFGIDFDAERGLSADQVEQLAATAAVVRFTPGEPGTGSA